MPSDLPDYAKLNDVSAGKGIGRGRLAGKRVLIVGGGQRKLDHIPGVDVDSLPPSNGRAFSIICAREGAMVAVHNRTLESAEATASLARKEKDCPLSVALEGDVTVEENVKRIVAEAVDKLGGKLDGMIINVGDAIGAPGLNISVQDMESVFRLNFLSHFMFCKYGLPLMNPTGSIVLVSSVTYVQSSGNIGYDATKSALEGLMRNVGAIMAPQGGRCNALQIGVADSPMGRAANHNNPARMGISIPLEKRLSTPWEQAYYGVFLLSDDSAYVTGGVHACDGGVTTLRNLYSH